MAVLRYLSVLVLALWIGGLVALGALAAPQIFAVLEAHDPESGRIMGGLVFGAIFTRFQHITWMLGGALVLLYVARAALGPRPRRTAVRLWTTTAMVAVSLVSALVLAPRIDAIRRDTAGAVAALPATDARRVEFGRLHALSTALMALTLFGGLGLLWAELRDHH
jgi:uncharacterized membrane protein